MSDMIERVAEALERNPTLCEMSEAAGGSEEVWKRQVREIARAAIGAMREPTDAMVNKGCNRLVELGVPYAEETVREVYDDMLRRALGGGEDSNPSELRLLKQAMIDAALSSEARPA